MINDTKRRPLRSRRRTRAVLLLLAAALAALLLASFSLGRLAVPWREAARILISRIVPIEITWEKNMEIAVLNIRLPRILLASLVGMSLSAAGATFQCVFRNPMAAPDILGASSGACFGAALAIFLGLSRPTLLLMAFAAGLLSVGAALAVNRCSDRGLTSLLLAGMMISALFSAGTSYIKLAADPANQLPAITYWLMGSFSGARMADVSWAAAPMALGVVPLLLLRWRMNLLSLGDEEARSMGVNAGRLRAASILCATLITAASVSVSGMVGWVGLVVPHLCRRLTGDDCRGLLPASMLMGAAFLLLADDVARNLLASEIPIGILTAFVGAPFFLIIMIRGRRGA